MAWVSRLSNFGFCDHNICSTRTIFEVCLDIFLFIQGMQQQKADIVNCLAGHFKGEKFDTKQL